MKKFGKMIWFITLDESGFDGQIFYGLADL